MAHAADEGHAMYHHLQIERQRHRAAELHRAAALSRPAAQRADRRRLIATRPVIFVRRVRDRRGAPGLAS
jgi:hypothetical protein